MAWRLARSLERLRDEVREVAPGTTVWTIGDAAHRARPSDHNPNSAGVVCAIDVVNDGGLDLSALAEQVRTGGHRAAKYVIYNRRITSRAHGWRWRHYSGSNPHSTHVHVSVGRGSDGQSTGPYDDTSPWGIGGSTGGDDVINFLGYERGMEGEHIQDFQKCLDDMGYTPANSRTSDGGWDGIYGGGVAAAVVQVRRDNGSESDFGDRVNYWANNQIRRGYFRAMLSRYGS